MSEDTLSIIEFSKDEKRICLRVDNLIENTFKYSSVYFDGATPKIKLEKFYNFYKDYQEHDRNIRVSTTANDILNEVNDILKGNEDNYDYDSIVNLHLMLKYGKYKDLIDIYSQDIIQSIVTELRAKIPSIMSVEVIQENEDNFRDIKKKNIEISIEPELNIIEVIEDRMKECQKEYIKCQKELNKLVSKLVSEVCKDNKNLTEAEIFEEVNKRMIEEIEKDIEKAKYISENDMSKLIYDDLNELGMGKKEKAVRNLIRDVDEYLTNYSIHSSLGDCSDLIKSLPSFKHFECIQNESSSQDDFDRLIENVEGFGIHKSHFKADICKRFLDEVHGRFTRAIINHLKPIIGIAFDLDKKLINVNLASIEELKDGFNKLNKYFIPFHMFFNVKNTSDDYKYDEVYIDFLMKGKDGYNYYEHNPMPDDWLNGMMILQSVYSIIQSQVLACLNSGDKNVSKMIREVISQDTKDVKLSETISTYDFIFDNPNIIIRVFDKYESSDKKNSEKKYSPLNADMTFFYHVIKYYMYASEFSEEFRKLIKDEGFSVSEFNNIGYEYKEKLAEKLLSETYNKLIGDEDYADVFTSVLSLRGLFEGQPRQYASLWPIIANENERTKRTLFTSRRLALLNNQTNTRYPYCETDSPTIINNELLLVGRLQKAKKESENGELVIPIAFTFQDIIQGNDEKGIKSSNGSNLYTREMNIKPSAFLGLKEIIKNPLWIEYMNGIGKNCPFTKLFNNVSCDKLQDGDINVIENKIESKMRDVRDFRILRESYKISLLLSDNYVNFYYELIKTALEASFNLKFSNTYQTVHYLSEDQDVLTGGRHYNDYRFEPS